MATMNGIVATAAGIHPADQCALEEDIPMGLLLVFGKWPPY